MTLILSIFDRKTWLTPKKMLYICFGSLVNCALIAAVLAGSGMVVEVLTRTGVALSFGSILVSVSLNSLLLVLVPFAFVYQPALLLNGSLWQIAASVALTVFGVVCLSSGVIGHLFAPLKPLQRMTLIAAAGFLVFSAQIDVILGLCAGIGGFAWSFIDSRATAARRPSVSPGS